MLLRSVVSSPAFPPVGCRIKNSGITYPPIRLDLSAWYPDLLTADALSRLDRMGDTEATVQPGRGYKAGDNNDIVDCGANPWTTFEDGLTVIFSCEVVAATQIPISMGSLNSNGFYLLRLSTSYQLRICESGSTTTVSIPDTESSVSVGDIVDISIDMSHTSGNSYDYSFIVNGYEMSSSADMDYNSSEKLGLLNYSSAPLNTHTGGFFNVECYQGSTLIRHFPCAESAGTDCLDISGNEANGIITAANINTFHTTFTDGNGYDLNLLGYTDNAGVLVPAVSASLDAQGNALQYPGRIKYNLQMVDGPCGNLNGTTDYVDTGISNVGHTDFSLKAKINIGAINCYPIGSTSGSEEGVALLAIHSNSLCRAYLYTSVGWQFVDGTTSLSVGETYDLEVKLSGTTLSVLVDGVQENSITISGTLGVSGGFVRLGNFSTNFYSGKLFDVWINDKHIPMIGPNQSRSVLPTLTYAIDGTECVIHAANINTFWGYQSTYFYEADSGYWEDASGRYPFAKSGATAYVGGQWNGASNKYRKPLAPEVIIQDALEGPWWIISGVQQDKLQSEIEAYLSGKAASFMNAAKGKGAADYDSIQTGDDFTTIQAFFA